jgi:hypothetical protein
VIEWGSVRAVLIDTIVDHDPLSWAPRDHVIRPHTLMLVIHGPAWYRP